ncbi:uncharacterized protein LOC126843011 [Adelges cooleyi]|uniref:uncharacterized protein LOC126843011 n=1 Tax=Adelges cooleyi TaxID=133065 RepID=UPI00217F9D3A|nr:uncharacterized protein LOC126843011 [Adelges cooleyi]
MSKLNKLNKDRLAKFIENLEKKNEKKQNNAFNNCILFLKTALHVSPNFVYDTTLETQHNVRQFFDGIDFSCIEPDGFLKLAPILKQGADIKSFICYIDTILNKYDVKFNTLLIDVWNYLGCDIFKLPVFIHERCIEAVPFIFENTVLYGIISSCNEELIDICTRSPKVFQACSSILNEILIRLNFSSTFINFLTNFIKGIILQCKTNNVEIFNIYPAKYKFVLILNDFENFNNILITEFFMQEIKSLALNYPKQFICLLSHFPSMYLMLDR